LPLVPSGGATSLGRFEIRGFALAVGDNFERIRLATTRALALTEMALSIDGLILAEVIDRLRISRSPPSRRTFSPRAGSHWAQKLSVPASPIEIRVETSTTSPKPSRPISTSASACGRSASSSSQMANRSAFAPRMTRWSSLRPPTCDGFSAEFKKEQAEVSTLFSHLFRDSLSASFAGDCTGTVFDGVTSTRMPFGDLRVGKCHPTPASKGADNLGDAKAGIAVCGPPRPDLYGGGQRQAESD
jgi:hypothetical protein